MNIAICRITKPEPLVTELTSLVAVPKGYKSPCMYCTPVCYTHWNESGLRVRSGSVHTGSQTGAAGLPGAQDAAVLPIANTWTWSRHFFNAFLLSTPLLSGRNQWYTAAEQPAAMTSCQANKNAIFGFRLQKMLNPSLASSPSLW